MLKGSREIKTFFSNEIINNEILYHDKIVQEIRNIKGEIQNLTEGQANDISEKLKGLYELQEDMSNRLKLYSVEYEKKLKETDELIRLHLINEIVDKNVC